MRCANVSATVNSHTLSQWKKATGYNRNFDPSFVNVTRFCFVSVREGGGGKKKNSKCYERIIREVLAKRYLR